MNTTTQSPSYGTFALLLAVAGLGGWALHEGVGGEPRPGSVSTAPVVDRGQVGAQPINLTIVPAAPPRTGHKGVLQRVETHRVWPTGQTRPVLAYRLLELFFEDHQAARDAVGSREAGGFFPSVFELGADGVHIVYDDES